LSNRIIAKARSGEPARHDVERRRRLADRLAGPARELLAHVLHDLPLPRHHFQRLGDVFAELGEAGRAAAGAGGRTRHDHPLARQMRRQRPARWPPAGGSTRRGVLVAGRFGGDRVLRGGGLELLELQLHLLEQPRLALAALAVELAPQLLDRQPQMRDQRLGARSLGPRLRELGAPDTDQPLQCLDIVGQRIIGAHRRSGDHKSERRGSPRSRAESECRNQPAVCGRQVRCGARQSIPSSR
jgi:hypothetical protein